MRVQFFLESVPDLAEDDSGFRRAVSHLSALARLLGVQVLHQGQPDHHCCQCGIPGIEVDLCSRLLGRR